MNVQTESLIKTIIVFKDGLVDRLMSKETAAANALVGFQELGLAMQEGKIERVKINVQSKYFQTLSKAFGAWDDVAVSPVDEVKRMTAKQQDALIGAFSKLATKVVDADVLPVVGGCKGVQKIWDKLNKQGDFDG